jgi:hypothetical protein
LALTRNNAQNDRAFREVSYGTLRQAERQSVSYGYFQTPSFLLVHLEAAKMQVYNTAEWSQEDSTSNEMHAIHCIAIHSMDDDADDTMQK